MLKKYGKIAASIFGQYAPDADVFNPAGCLQAARIAEKCLHSAYMELESKNANPGGLA